MEARKDFIPVTDERGQTGPAPQPGRDDHELLRAMFAEHGDALYAHALRLVSGDRQRAEDLVQETLLRAWRHPGAMDPDRGSVRAWLFTTARNLAIDSWRRRSVRVTEVITDTPPEAPG